MGISRTKQQISLIFEKPVSLVNYELSIMRKNINFKEYIFDSSNKKQTYVNMYGYYKYLNYCGVK
jgi:hypothetical protein